MDFNASFPLFDASDNSIILYWDVFFTGTVIILLVCDEKQ